MYSEEHLAVDFSPPTDKNVASDETKRMLKY
jgi:hypothetical protein